MMETPTVTSPIDSILPIISQAVMDWQVANSPEAIKKKVTTLLDKNKEEIVYKLLGFNKDSWNGNWSLDHCNGRSGDSAAGDYLRNVQSEAIRAWMETIPLPVIPPKMLADFKRQYQREFDDRIQYQMRQLITQEADKRADELFKNISSSTQLDDFLKVMKIINPQGTIHES